MHVCVKFDEHWLHHLDCTASAGIHAIFADFAISLTFNGFCGVFFFCLNLGSLDFKTSYLNCLVTFELVLCIFM